LIDFAQAQSADADSLQRYTEQGQKALASGRYEEAERAFEKFVNWNQEWRKCTQTWEQFIFKRRNSIRPYPPYAKR